MEDVYDHEWDDHEWEKAASAACGDEGWLRSNDDSDGERCAGVSGDAFPGDWTSQSQYAPIICKEAGGACLAATIGPRGQHRLAN